MKTLFTVALLFPLALSPQSNKKNKGTTTAQRRTVDTGSFDIYQSGKRIGTETFSFKQRTNDAVLAAQISVDDGINKAEQSVELRIGTEGALKLYKWRSTVPVFEESVVESKADLIVEHVTSAEQKTRDVRYVLPLSTMILDDNFFSQRELLVWRYLATGCTPRQGQLHCGPSHFGILIPHQHIAASIAVELKGRDKITFRGAERELNKITLDAAGVQWLIWVDDPENGYKVLRMSVPSANLEVLRDQDSPPLL